MQILYTNIVINLCLVDFFQRKTLCFRLLKPGEFFFDSLAIFGALFEVQKLTV